MGGEEQAEDGRYQGVGVVGVCILCLVRVCLFLSVCLGGYSCVVSVCSGQCMHYGVGCRVVWVTNVVGSSSVGYQRKNSKTE